MLLPLLWLAGCSSWQTEGDYFFLRNDGADLPVWVRGNTDSGVLVVWLAGGPGDPVALAFGSATDRIERDYGVVYWDQRGAGTSQGNASPDSFSQAQLLDDTDAVVDLVTDLYQPDAVFLLGHSWGGTLGTGYLLDPERQAKITGWIDVAGNHDPVRVYPMKLAWLRDYADAQVQAGLDVAHWTEVRDWCDSDPPLTVENFDLWDHYVSGTDALFHDPDVGYAIGFDLLFRSGESPLAFLVVNRHYASDHIYDSPEAFAEYSFADRMGAITLPTELLWGREDGIVPLPVAQDAMAVLGTPAADQHLVVIDDAAHFSFLEKPEEFATAVADFVEAYR